MESLRRDRKGSMRMTQRELEQTFFGGLSSVAAGGTEAIRGARDFLLGEGVSSARVDDWIERLRCSPCATEAFTPGSGDVLADVLEELAFDTQVDLERARALLLGAWSAMSSGAPAELESPSADEAQTTELRPSPRVDLPQAADSTQVRAALDEFDRGRSDGKDLEKLFDRLEGELGAGEVPSEDGASAPDFPGVIGALVMEFRWERSADSAEASLPFLERLASFAASIGVPEQLGGAKLAQFAGVWSLDEGLLSSEQDVIAMLAELEDFARWVQDTQGWELWAEFKPFHSELRSCLPRLALARALAVSRSERDGVHTVVAMGDDFALVQAPGNEEIRCQIDASISSFLRVGDRLLARLEPGQELLVSGAYPSFNFDES